MRTLRVEDDPLARKHNSLHENQKNRQKSLHVHVGIITKNGTDHPTLLASPANGDTTLLSRRNKTGHHFPQIRRPRKLPHQDPASARMSSTI